MAGKIFLDSRYATSQVIPVIENGGRVIFVPHRKPLSFFDFPDNIIHTVRRSDRVDSLSSEFYGTPIYGWVISDFNQLLLPDIDLLTKDTIIAPSLITLQTKILPSLE